MALHFVTVIISNGGIIQARDEVKLSSWFWPEAWSHTSPPGMRSSPPGWRWRPPPPPCRHRASASAGRPSSRCLRAPWPPPGRWHSRSQQAGPSRGPAPPPCLPRRSSPSRCWRSGQRTYKSQFCLECSRMTSSTLTWCECLHTAGMFHQSQSL